MSQQRPEPEEQLSGTLLSGVQGLARALGGMSTTFALAGILSLIVAVLLFIFIPDLNLYAYIILGIGGALVLMSLAISIGTVSRAVTSRRGRYGANTAVMIVAFVALVGVGNFLAFEDTARKRIDVTATKQFTLAPRTEDLLRDLKETILAKAFFRPAGTVEEQRFQEQVEGLLREFEIRTDDFSFEFIDPDLDPLTAREYGLTAYNNIVFEHKDSKRKHQVSPSPFLEQDIVTALLTVTGEEQKRVYFVTGHGEKNIDDIQDTTAGFGLARQETANEFYAVSAIDLNTDEGRGALEKDRLDGNVNMLVVAGPTKDMLEGESEILHNYLKDGGQMLFLLEPDTPQSFRDFLARWGVLVGEGHIVDGQRNFGLKQNVAIHPDQYISVRETQEITASLERTFYPGVTSLLPAKGVAFFPDLTQGAGEEEGQEPTQITPTVTGVALAFTTDDSWLIKDSGRNDHDTEIDTQGPFFPAVAFQAVGPLDEALPVDATTVNLASLIVVGDADFASNRFFYGSGGTTASNSDFFLNSVNWLVGDIPLANIRPKPFAFRELVLTRNQFNTMRYISWFFLPSLMALAGGLVWWRRR